ncbi:hypothetical protein MMC12_006327 [Toensbergia leucococca]|nr:hypothetical protein [Toensbergia leucococca]
MSSSPPFRRNINQITSTISPPFHQTNFATTSYSTQPEQSLPGFQPSGVSAAPKKRKTSDSATGTSAATSPTMETDPRVVGEASGTFGDASSSPPAPKKSRTNTPWTPAEEQRLKNMRDTGSSWSDIAKTFPTRTEGSVKKHWYKDMHYADFAEDESAALLAAIKEYEANKWKVIGQKVGKPAKACEQYAKENFAGRI